MRTVAKKMAETVKCDQFCLFFGERNCGSFNQMVVPVLLSWWCLFFPSPPALPELQQWACKRHKRRPYLCFRFWTALLPGSCPAECLRDSLEKRVGREIRPVTLNDWGWTWFCVLLVEILLGTNGVVSGSQLLQVEKCLYSSSIAYCVTQLRLQQLKSIEIS